MNINFNGYGENVITFEADKSIKEAGVPVKMCSSAKVSLAQPGDSDFCGIAVNLRGGYAAVQLNGYVKVKLAGEGNIGYQKLIALEEGKVAIDAGGKEHLVIDYNDTEKTIGFIL